MRRTKVTVTILMVAVMFFSLITGCGTVDKANEASTAEAEKSTISSENASTVKTKEEPFKDHIEISIAMWDIGSALPEGINDLVRDAIFKKLNITIKPVNITWDDYTQKVQIWAASSQLPDIFAADAVKTQNFENWITQGIVRELPGDLSPYPNVKKIIDSQDGQCYKYPLGANDGKFFCVPRLIYTNLDMMANFNAIIIRKDWMENVGITKAPENMDEFITLMKAFVEKDPDKNSKKDTIGLTCYAPSWLGFLMLGYEPGMVSGYQWIRDNGKWMPAFTTKNALIGLKEIKRLYDAGGLDMDFATLKGTEGLDRFTSGRAGAFAWGCSPSNLTEIDMKWNKTYPDKKLEDNIIIIHPFKNIDGNYYRLISPNTWSENYINAKCDDKKYDRILRLLDYFLSEEAINYMNYGIEGVDYKKVDGNIEVMPLTDANGKKINIWDKYPVTLMQNFAQWAGASINDYVNPRWNETFRKITGDELKWRIDNCIPTGTDLKISFIKYPSKSKEVATFNDDIVKAVMSKDIDKTWNDIISGYMANGYDKCIEELNTAAAQAGIK